MPISFGERGAFSPIRLKRPIERLEAAASLLPRAAEGQLLEAAIDGRGACSGMSAIATAADDQRPEDEGEQRQEHRHDYTSILTTCLIQMYPMVCITIATISSIWPMRSRNSMFM